jgi:hypothetical protein
MNRDAAERMARRMRAVGFSAEETTATMPILHALGGFPAPQLGPSDHARLVAALVERGVGVSPVRVAIRRRPAPALAAFGALLRTQARVFTPVFWVGSAVVAAAGFAALSAGLDAGRGLILYLAGPLLAYLGVHAGFRASRLGMVELEFACPVSARQLVLARLAVILGYDLILGLLLAGGLAASGGQPWLRLAVQWFAPLLLVAGAATLASVWAGFASAAGVAYGIWAAAVITMWRLHGGAGIGLTAPGNIALALTGATLLAAAVVLAPRLALALPRTSPAGPA